MKLEYLLQPSFIIRPLISHRILCRGSEKLLRLDKREVFIKGEWEFLNKGDLN